MAKFITDYHAKYYAHELTKQASGNSVERLSTSLFDASVDLNPHQIEAALFALRSPLSKGVVLADEVGLGKTIEAGLVLCQYWAERKRNLLIICPASLRRQWANELSEKFNLPCIILDSATVNQLRKNGIFNPFEQQKIIIVSYQYAFRMEEQLVSVSWNLVTIDEAHKLRNAHLKTNRIGQSLRRSLFDRQKLLLTATPLQNSLIELYGLSTLIDENLFGDDKSFRAQYLNAGSDLGGLKARLGSFIKRTLREQVSEYVPYTERKTFTQKFTPSNNEQNFYDLLSTFMLREDSYSLPKKQRHLTNLILRKLLASSTHAVTATLEHIQKRLEALKNNSTQETDEEFIQALIESDELEDDYLENLDDETEENTNLELNDNSLDIKKLDEEITELGRYISDAHLGLFLRHELDFYIKNEVMNLDDVQNAQAFADIEKNLRLIQTLREIALDLVTFLAQLEDFQKKLWLKKKFVVSAHYCITLDRVPESLYSKIAANSSQWEQWESLGMLVKAELKSVFNQAEKGTVDYLKANPFLMVDTALFDSAFKYELLAQIHDLDENLDGLLIHGDNFQALNLLQERYREQVQCVYIDPPYNTGGDGFVYKDNYQHSSWMSMIKDRMNNLVHICSDESVLFLSIDDNEVAILKLCLDDVFGKSSFESQTIIQSNKRGQTYQKIAKTHEYLLIYRIGENSDLAEIEKEILDSPLVDSSGSYELWELRNRNPKFGKHNRPNLYYPVYVNANNLNSDGYAKISLEQDSLYSFETYPKNSVGEDSCWRWGKEKLLKAIKENTELNMVVAKQKRDGGWNIYEKSRKSSTKAKSIWFENDVISEQGTVEVGNLGFTDFGFPKPTGLLKKALKIGSLSDGIVFDYFAGSGTTAHAVINLNRQDNGNRKYILVEQGDYFDTVLKPRVQKVVYSADWKDGKATAPQTGISHAFKVLQIESYEDTLNNLELKRTQSQIDLLSNLPEAKEDYLLRYMLDIESRGSLLCVDDFKKPFDYKLKISIDSAGAYEERKIDLIETFNYLIGLRVTSITMQADKGFATIEGLLPTDEKTLVLWRDVEKVGYEELTKLCDKLKINPADSEFEVIYINGDHNIPNTLTSLENEDGITKTLKLRQIEPEFLRLMFETV